MPVDYVWGKTECPECGKHRCHATHTYPMGKRQMRCLSCSHPFVAIGERKDGAAHVERHAATAPAVSGRELGLRVSMARRQKQFRSRAVRFR